MNKVKHLACIMDGNRRWAKGRGLLFLRGYDEGANAAKRTIGFCLKEKIPFLSLYTFSTENVKGRSEDEKKYLFETIAVQAKKIFLDEFINKGVKVRFFGELSLFSEEQQQLCREIELKTQQGDQLEVGILLAYGAHQEILDAVKNIAHDFKSGKIKEADITEQRFRKYLWTSEIPDPDLIVRTGGCSRLSNFLLYQAAYSELFFLDCFWPEIQESHLNNVIQTFASCKRNFGH